MPRHERGLPKLYGLMDICNMFPLGSRPSTDAIQKAAIECGACRQLSGKIYFTAEDVESLLEHIAAKRTVNQQGANSA